MKYAQMLMGLLVGTALGGSVVAATGTQPMAQSGAGMDAEAIKKIVRQTISEEPKLIMDSVQKFQESQRNAQVEDASTALKDKALREAVYNSKDAASYGPQDSKRVIVEFFDYNCPACKSQHKMFDELLAKDKTVRIIYREYPIFGAVSETNSRIGLAVSRLAPEKYHAFYEKMMSHEGRATEKDALGYAKDVGLDVEKVKTEMKKPEINAILEHNRELGDKLHIQGTPTVIVGDEMIPHAVDADELAKKLNAAK